MNKGVRTAYAAYALPLLLVLAAQGGSCGARAVGVGGEMNDAQERRLAPGAWGGEGVRLDVKEDGSAAVEFDCAHGSLGEVATGEGGEFSVSGVFVKERGGPERADEEPEKMPARYEGKISGGTMTLRVSVQGMTGELTFTLARGKAGRLRKCL